MSISKKWRQMLQGAVRLLPSSQDMEAVIRTKAAGGRMASAVRGSSAKRKPDLRRRSGYGVPVQTEKSLEKLNKKALLSVGKQGFFILGCCPKF